MEHRKITGYFPHSKKASSSTADKKSTSTSTQAAKNNDQAAKELESLTKFDLDFKFGPCTGVTRLERWERAEKHGLNPPPEVKKLLLAHKGDEVYRSCLWSKYDL
ncbi:DNA polymerase delta subunit 4-like [Lingula anatina]|uniref:DNA polymerase delta subunit 4-like n=1 Tax=Lingula anatina TaxID=7574 RepID=A0A1S3IKL3_LINAN|nr:DNA polymerase delta subunit 4-like [Lingula anatina]|eukprot:XP_013398431.2 DNA polymerase delta subunit 4-like [Lingula anatina]